MPEKRKNPPTREELAEEARRVAGLKLAEEEQRLKDARRQRGSVRRKRTEFKKAKQRSDIMALYAQGMEQKAIAEYLGIHESTVSRDIDAIEKAWLKSAVINFSLARQRMIEDLQLVKQEALDGWLRSLENAETSEDINSSEKGRTTKRKSIGQAGDPRFLKTLIDCERLIAELQGLITKNVDLKSGGQPLGASLAEGMATLFNQIGAHERAQLQLVPPKERKNGSGAG